MIVSDKEKHLFTSIRVCQHTRWSYQNVTFYCNSSNIERSRFFFVEILCFVSHFFGGSHYDVIWLIVNNPSIVLKRHEFLSFLFWTHKKVSPHLECDGHNWRHEIDWLFFSELQVSIQIRRIWLNAKTSGCQVDGKNGIHSKLQFQVNFNWPNFQQILTYFWNSNSS